MSNKTKSISLEQAIRNGDTGKNQDIKQKFVGQHVFCNVGTLAEYCLLMAEQNSQAPFSYDDIENFYTLNTEKVIDDAVELWDDKHSDFIEYANDPDTFNRKVKTESDFRVFLHSLDEDELKDFCDAFDIDQETEPQEILEWWAVSSFLFEKLKAEGCAVVDAGSCHIWGRTTSGQAILLDGVITRICADMEILEGQSNSWAQTKTRKQ